LCGDCSYHPIVNINGGNNFIELLPLCWAQHLVCFKQLRCKDCKLAWCLRAGWFFRNLKSWSFVGIGESDPAFVMSSYSSLMYLSGTPLGQNEAIRSCANCDKSKRRLAYVPSQVGSILIRQRWPLILRSCRENDPPQLLLRLLALIMTSMNPRHTPIPYFEQKIIEPPLRFLCFPVSLYFLAYSPMDLSSRSFRHRMKTR
jgi:hypothetical protein